jgi:hypothetical protein
MRQSSSDMSSSMRSILREFPGIGLVMLKLRKILGRWRRSLDSVHVQVFARANASGYSIFLFNRHDQLS